MDDIGKCPVMHGSVTTNSGISTTNRDWWPNQLNLNILHQNDKRSNPMSLDFDYREEFKKLDYQALKKENYVFFDWFHYITPKKLFRHMVKNILSPYKTNKTKNCVKNKWQLSY